MSVSLKGFNQNAVTLKAASGLAAGDVVKISANHTAAKCAAGNIPCGICLITNNKYATVQITGWAKVKYSSGTPTLGYAAIVSDGIGGVKLSTTGRPVLIASIDDSSSTMEIILL